MTTFEIPQLVPNPNKNFQPDSPGLEARIGDLPKPLVTTASKKVDDLSRHESRHDMAPKHEPKLNPREKGHDGAKPDGCQPQGGKPEPSKK